MKNEKIRKKRALNGQSNGSFIKPYSKGCQILEIHNFNNLIKTLHQCGAGHTESPCARCRALRFMRAISETACGGIRRGRADCVLQGALRNMEDSRRELFHGKKNSVIIEPLRSKAEYQIFCRNAGEVFVTESRTFTIVAKIARQL